MNEKETITKRANHFGRNHGWSDLEIEMYIQGALDQDPISRKKRTEEIKDAIFKDPQLQKSLRYADFDRILTLIEALP